MKKTMVFVGNDKKGREFLAKNLTHYEVLAALDGRSHSMKRVFKLIQRGSLRVSTLMQMTWAEMLRPNFKNPGLPFISSNTELMQFIKLNNIKRLILYRVGLIISPKLINTGIEIINIHSARLPDYAGLMAVRRALDADDFSQEATAHEVVAKIDTGKVIATIPYTLDPIKSYRQNEDNSIRAGEELLTLLLRENLKRN